MSTQLKLRRGTTAQHSTFTGAEGEVTVDTDKDTLVVHDGTTAGGKPVLPASNPSYTGTLTGGTGVVNLGSGQVYKDASGNVGIGTSSPTLGGTRGIHIANSSGDSRLHLTDNTTGATANDGTELVVANGDFYIDQKEAKSVIVYTNGAERARIDSSGRLSIGTTAAYSTLNVNGATGAKIFYTGGTEADSSGVLALGDGSRSTNYVGLYRGDALTTSSLAMLSVEAYAGIRFCSSSTVLGSNTERARIMSDGSFLFGKTTADVTSAGIQFEAGLNYGRFNFTKASASGTGATPAMSFYYAGTGVGQITNTSTGTAYVTTSDYRLKEDVAPMTGALAKIALLKPCTYKWKSDGSDSQGFIAHELQAVVPDCVVGEKDAVALQQVEISPAVTATFDADGNELTPAIEAVFEEREVPQYQGIDTSFLVATLTAAIQEQQTLITALTARIDILEQGGV